MPQNKLMPMSPEQDGFNYYFDPSASGFPNFGIKLKIAGETVLAARTDTGSLHKGLEKMMEYRTAIQNAVLSDRINIYESLNWNLAHAEAVEELAGMEVPERARYIRVVMAELSRIQSHMLWYGLMCLNLGSESGFNMALSSRDFIIELFAVITGGKAYPAGYICPGGVRIDLPVGGPAKVGIALDEVEGWLQKTAELDDKVLMPKTKGVGVLRKDEAVSLGASGPVLRASGAKTDIRKEDPYEIYENLDFETPIQEEGDAWARCLVRKLEIAQSVKIIRQGLEGISGGDIKSPLSLDTPLNLPTGEVFVRNEMPRGEGAIAMVGNGSWAPYRVKVRTADFLNAIPILEHLLAGARTQDIAAIYRSLDICPTAVER